MTPSRAPVCDPAAAGSASEYNAIVGEMAVLQGQINVAEARMVALTARALGRDLAAADGLRPGAWMACRTGAAPGRADGAVRLARRSAELPATIEALGRGALSLDQAIEIAKYVPARFEASAARVAPFLTVAQLRTILPHYRDRRTEPEQPPRRHVRSGVDDHGYWADIRLPEDEGALFDQALKATWEDLKQQARSEAGDAEPQPVTLADAAVAVARHALESGDAARPGTDRYLVQVHLQAGPHGLVLATHLGIEIPPAQRRRLLCDANLRAVVHDAETGAPLNAGRATRHISRRLRRAVEHRDGGCCTIPGCGRTTGLEIHHVIHWEDGGPTDTWNLLTLCSYHHHHVHHQGLLGIEGDADLPRHEAPGVRFTNRWGRPLHPAPPPPVGTGLDGTAQHYVGPTGERVDRWGFHLQEAAPPP